jgi:DNA-directed RNA polymerase specialized sigma24 family protein
MVTLFQKQSPATEAPLTEEFFEDLYKKMFPAVARFVRSQNGTFEDARDIFHDALVIFYEKSLDEKAGIQLSPEAYVFGIFRHLWIRKFKEARQTVFLTEEEDKIDIPADYFPHPRTAKILRLLQLAGERCLALLKSFYYEKRSLEDISRAFAFSGVRSATVQKFKCLQKMRDEIKSKSLEYDDFLE